MAFLYNVVAGAQLARTSDTMDGALGYRASSSGCWQLGVRFLVNSGNLRTAHWLDQINKNRISFSNHSLETEHDDGSFIIS